MEEKTIRFTGCRYEFMTCARAKYVRWLLPNLITVLGGESCDVMSCKYYSLIGTIIFFRYKSIIDYLNGYKILLNNKILTFFHIVAFLKTVNY